MQEMHVVVGDDAIHEQSSQCRSCQKKELYKKGYDDDPPKQAGVLHKILHISPYRLTLVRNRLEPGTGFERQSHSCKRVAELLHRYEATATSGIDNFDAVFAQPVEDNEMRKVPV